MNQKPTTFERNNPNLRPPKTPHIRHIKSEFFQHEEVADLSALARLAWIGIWTRCDKHGRFEWRPKTLKVQILPFDNVDFEELLIELAGHGFVVRYEIAGKVWGQVNTYGFVPNWHKHQAINAREKASAFEYPAPPNAIEPVEESAARAMSEGVGKGKGECKGECKGE